MAQTHSFDIVSKVDLHEVQNAVNQAVKEMRQRFDFKGSKSEIELNQKDRELTITTEDEYKLKNVLDILQGRLVKRGVALKALSYGKVEEASGAMVRQKIKIQSGIEKESCKDIVKFIKSTKLKVQSSIQDEQVRVSAAKKDDLQEVIEQLKGKDYDFHMEFVNYR
jgi:uncharacterized protein YajQ (UPF0234 family)